MNNKQIKEKCTKCNDKGFYRNLNATEAIST